jgi:hypothetical protein
MNERGFLAPETRDAVRDAFADVAPVAQSVTREVAKAMAMDREEYDERVTGDVVATAHDALFAELLTAYTGTRDEYADWRADHPTFVEARHGSDDVDHVAWHPVHPTETVVLATYQNEPDAAVSTLRRIAFGSHYRELLD